MIGLPGAAALSKLGKRVTFREAVDRVLARVAGEPLSRFYEGEHRAQGVDVRLGVTVDRIASAHGRVSGVHLVSGEVLPCQLVIVGIGIVPAIEPLRAAGAGKSGVQGKSVSVRVDLGGGRIIKKKTTNKTLH